MAEGPRPGSGRDGRGGDGPPLRRPPLLVGRARRMGTDAPACPGHGARGEAGLARRAAVLGPLLEEQPGFPRRRLSPRRGRRPRRGGRGAPGHGHLRRGRGGLSAGRREGRGLPSPGPHGGQPSLSRLRRDRAARREWRGRNLHARAVLPHGLGRGRSRSPRSRRLHGVDPLARRHVAGRRGGSAAVHGGDRAAGRLAGARGDASRRHRRDGGEGARRRGRAAAGREPDRGHCLRDADDGGRRRHRHPGGGRTRRAVAQRRAARPAGHGLPRAA